MTGTNSTRESSIDKRDFDAHRPLLGDDEDRARRGGGGGGFRSRSESRISRRSANSDGDAGGNDGILSDVVEGIVQRDRRKLERDILRVCSFSWGVISCLGAGSITAFSLYGPLLLSRLHYSQMRVNAVSIAAEISLYLPAPIFGYLCDRYTPSPLALLAAFLFGGGYLLAALTYRSGPPPDTGGSGWPFGVMIIAFVLVGSGTSCLYLAAVGACAKNFGRGKHKGIMLAVPIAAFGLSGMWQSQVGTYLLYEPREDGSRGDVDVFKYFLFLAVLLFGIGVVGTFALRIVDGDDKYIDEAVEELERSGYVDESDFFRSREEVQAAYGTFSRGDDGSSVASDGQSLVMSDEEREARRQEKEREEEERRKKNWLLNYETKIFLKDQTMWWLALGFFLVTGPGEAYINNLGTIIETLTPTSYPPTSPPPAGLPSTHVTTIALTSTIARILTGSLSDLFAPPAKHFFPGTESTLPSQSTHITLSRLTFLLPSTILLSLGYLLLASPLPLQTPPLFHLTTALVGLGYGAAFSLVPILISAVWGVENFATNWGIVAMVPAGGAAVWGLVYSRGYQDALDAGDGQCRGWACYGFWAVGCTASVWVAVLVWCLAWRGWKKRGVVV